MAVSPRPVGGEVETPAVESPEGETSERGLRVLRVLRRVVR
jgi:hypothetical protein